MSTAAIVAGTAASGLASSVIGANGAENAASTQAAAAQQAQQLQQQEAQQALVAQQTGNQTAQSEIAPYAAAGAGGLNALQYGLGTGGTANGSGVGSGSLLTPYSSFTAPTATTDANDPGYQARLALSSEAIQRSAAANGGVVTGGTAQALGNNAQDYASNEYNNVYNRALQTYGTNASNYYTGQTNDYNRLSALTGIGQTATAASVASGQNAANQSSNIDLTTGAQQGADLTNQGAATASGYVGAANAYSSGLNGATSNLTNLALLNNLKQAPSTTAASNSAYASLGGSQYADPD